MQAQVDYSPGTGGTYHTYYTNSATGVLKTASVNDGRPRSIALTNDALGQALRRDEADGNGATGDPHELWYRFNGKQIGYIGNNDTDNIGYAASLQRRVTASVAGPFKNGQAYGAGIVDFDQAYDAINSYQQGAGGGSYTVRDGDTLSGIAAQLWGDAGLWYKLAQANGLAGDGALVAGQTLGVPAGVVRSSNNAGTFRPYDVTQAYGDSSPTTPAPQAAKKNKCGAFGAILLVAIAVAVTIATHGAAAGLFAGTGTVTTAGATLASGLVLPAITAAVPAMTAAGAIAAGATAAMAGAIVSQGVGLATGIQDKFDWKGVALAGLSGGLTAGIGIDKIAGSAFLGKAVSGAIASAATQGIGVATGLQSKFDWAGVAGAGIGAGVGQALGGKFDNLGKIGASLAANTAGGIANAATRSLVNGTDFGDNLMAALPDIIGSTIGGLIASKVAGVGHRSTDTTKTVIDPQTGQKIVVDAALADQINLRRDGKQIDAEIAAGIRNPDGSLRDGGAPGGSVTVVDASGRPPGDYLNPYRADTFSRSINEYWRQGFEATDAAHLASVGHEYTDASELRQAYADRDAYLAKLDAYATQMVDKPIAYAVGGIALGALTAGTGTVILGGLGWTGASAFAFNAGVDGLSVANTNIGLRAAGGGRTTLRSYGTDVVVGSVTGGVGRLTIAGGGIVMNRIIGDGFLPIAERTAIAGETRAGTALQTYWPPNRGFQGAPITEELSAGTRIDRYGYEGGTFLSPEGTPSWMRSLAPGTTSKPYNVYEVVNPIEVQSGKAAPWFGQLGGGTQHELPMSVSDAIARGHLRRVGP